MNQELSLKIQSDNEEKINMMNNYYKSRDNPSDPEVLKLLQIGTDDAVDVKCFDSVDNLQLFHSINQKNERVNHVRGIVIDTEKMRVVCKSFPFTAEIPTCILPQTTLTDDKVASAIIKNSYEGTILRIFGRNISTHRKIDGTRSVWNSKPFGDLLKDCLGLLEEEVIFDHLKLDERYCYVFLIKHPQNALVCKHTKPEIYHLTTYDIDNFMYPVNIKIEHPKVQYIEELNIKTQAHLVKHVESLGCKDYSGVVMYFPEGNVVKIVSNEYFTKRQIIGNEPNQKFRYLQLRKLGMTYNIIKGLIPHKTKFYKSIEIEIDMLKDKLVYEFNTRYIYKKFTVLPQERHLFIKNLHDEPRFSNVSIKDKQRIRDEILQRLNEMNPSFLLSMLNGIEETK